MGEGQVPYGADWWFMAESYQPASVRTTHDCAGDRWSRRGPGPRNALGRSPRCPIGDQRIGSGDERTRARTYRALTGASHHGIRQNKGDGARGTEDQLTAMAVRDKLARGAEPFLRPGEEVEAVFLAKRPNVQGNDRAVIVTDRRLLLFGLNMLGRPTFLLAGQTRRVRLGPGAGALYRLPAFSEQRLSVHRRFFRDIDAADRAAGFEVGGAAGADTLPPGSGPAGSWPRSARRGPTEREAGDSWTIESDGNWHQDRGVGPAPDPAPIPARITLPPGWACRITGMGMFLALLLFPDGSSNSNMSNGAFVLSMTLLALVVLGFVVRGRWIGMRSITLTPDHLHVRRWFSTNSIPWSDIEVLRIGRVALACSVVQVGRKGSSTMRLTGLVGFTPRTTARLESVVVDVEHARRRFAVGSGCSPLTHLRPACGG